MEQAASPRQQRASSGLDMTALPFESIRRANSTAPREDSFDAAAPLPSWGLPSQPDAQSDSQPGAPAPRLPLADCLGPTRHIGSPVSSAEASLPLGFATSSSATGSVAAPVAPVAPALPLPAATSQATPAAPPTDLPSKGMWDVPAPKHPEHLREEGAFNHEKFQDVWSTVRDAPPLHSPRGGKAVPPDWLGLPAERESTAPTPRSSAERFKQAKTVRSSMEGLPHW